MIEIFMLETLSTRELITPRDKRIARNANMRKANKQKLKENKTKIWRGNGGTRIMRPTQLLI